MAATTLLTIFALAGCGSDAPAADAGSSAQEPVPVFDGGQDEDIPAAPLPSDPAETIAEIRLMIGEKTTERDRLFVEYADIQGMLELLKTENNDPARIETYEKLIVQNEQKRAEIDKAIAFYEQQIQSLEDEQSPPGIEPDTIEPGVEEGEPPGDVPEDAPPPEDTLA